jgi:hypothetical protein
MPKVQLSASEAARCRKPIRGRGGFQTLLKKIASKIGADNTVVLSDDDLEKLLRYSFNYGRGGFQERTKAATRSAKKK